MVFPFLLRLYAVVGKRTYLIFMRLTDRTDFLLEVRPVY